MGDFLICCGEDCGLCGEKVLVVWVVENGVEIGGVLIVLCCDWEGVLFCCERVCFIGVGVVILNCGWFLLFEFYRE